jgi:hypothetical protein
MLAGSLVSFLVTRLIFGNVYSPGANFGGIFFGSFVWIAIGSFLYTVSRSDTENDPVLVGSDRSAKMSHPFGIYDAHRTLLSPSEAASAIHQFDLEDCNDFLRRFGHPLSSDQESLDALRLRCQRVLEVTSPIE